MWRTEDNKNILYSVVDNSLDFIVFDTETTGLNAKKNTIIQISAIKYAIHNAEFKETAKLNIYINPEKSIPPKITELTGITNEFIMEHPVEDEVVNDIFEYFGDNPIIAGYNVGFDIKFMEALYQRHGKTFNPKIVLDVIKMARDNIEKKDVPNYKLCNVAEYYGLSEGIKFHDSMGDVKATAQLMFVFYDEYKENEKKILNCEKKEAIITGLKYDKGKGPTSFIYIYTNLGTFFYNIRDKYWKACSTNIYKNKEYEIDMEKLRMDAFEISGAKSEEEFARYRGTKLNQVNKTEEKKKPVIQSINRWEKYSLKRLYVETDLGILYYDINKKIWNTKDGKINISQVDVDKFENDCFKFIGVDNKEEFVAYGIK